MVQPAGMILALMMMAFSAVSARADGARATQLVVGFSAGGPTDIVARTFAAKMAEVLKVNIVVENRVGASGNIASEAVARSAPDGRTLLMAPVAFAVNETLFPNRHFEYAQDFVAVAPLAETANALVVHPSLGAASVAEVVALGRQRGELLYATAGRGTVTHVAGELFADMTGVKMVPVHYKGGGDLIQDLLSGEVKVSFSTIPPVRDFIANGSLNALATTGLERDRMLPNTPTLNEAGLRGYELRLWLGLLAPRGTPVALVRQLSEAVRVATASAEVKNALDVQGFQPMSSGPEEFDTFMKSEIAKWGALVRRIGVGGN
jgi:tripartite-type tricarboxylate transporter receptor subunit TctC